MLAVRRTNFSEAAHTTQKLQQACAVTTKPQLNNANWSSAYIWIEKSVRKWLCPRHHCNDKSSLSIFLAFHWVKPSMHMVHLCATRFNIQHSTINQQTALLCFVGFVKISYTTLIWFDNRKGECLQSSTTWIFKYNSVYSSSLKV
jgi:hypothetical protein